MTQTRVFDGAHLRATLSLPDTAGGAHRRLLVTFDFRKPGKSEFGPPARSDSLDRAGIAQLSIRTRTNDWFVNPDTVALEAALPTIVAPFEEVRALGFSMGGFGAFRLSGALRAQSVLAVSPQSTLDPALVQFERRYPEAASFDPDIGTLPHGPAGLSGLILVDPFVAPDLAHANRLAAHFPGVRIVRLGLAGHPAHGILRDAGKVWLLQRTATLPPDDGALRAAHRAGRRQSAAYWTRLAERAKTRRPTLAQTARQRAAHISQ